MPRQSPRKAKTAAAQPIVRATVVSAKKEEIKTNGTVVKVEEAVESKVSVIKKKKSAPKKRKAADADEQYACDSCDEKDVKEEAEADEKPAKKRRTKKIKDEDMSPLAARTAISALKKAVYIGAHVSGAGGVQNSIPNALYIGANAFAVFLKSQRKWAFQPLDSSTRDQFIQRAAQASYSPNLHVVPHGSYLVNLAQPDAAKAAQAYDSFVDDLRRCEELGIGLYNFHPGSTGGEPRAEALARIAAQLNRAHGETSTVVTLLENMCGSGNVIGSRFEELRDIIAMVQDKSRVGVCLDTCHAFGAGYDLRTPEAFEKTMEEFERVIGLKYLKALHLNDSKAPLDSHRDLHANIGTGFLGLRAFHNVVNYAPLQNLPMVLETPIERPGPDGKMVEDKQVWADEIKLLEGLVGADTESEAFRAREAELQARGEAERRKIQDQVDRKGEKNAKKAGKGGAKRKMKKKTVESDDESGSG